jgi:NADH:ubiquinone oxidoreductase subunit 5 (subunit L)/multisubunit Na+/H+ antiporter MnhA subunit
MGGLVYLLPITYMSLLSASLAIIGFPFLSGFYSKDYLLEFAGTGYTVYSNFVYQIGILTAFITAFYSFRLIFLTFFGTTRIFKSSAKTIHEAPILMLLTFIFLFIGTIFAGYFFKELLIGVGTDFWSNSIFIQFRHYDVSLIEFKLSWINKLVPVFLSLSGAILSIIFYENKSFQFYSFLIKRLQTNFAFICLNHFFNKKWYFDNFINVFFVRKALSFGYNISFKLIDRGFIEFLGPQGAAKVLYQKNLLNLQSGYLFHYIFILIFGTFLAVLFLLLGLQSQLNLIFVLISTFYLLKYKNEKKV